MAMSVSQDGGEVDAMSDINTTPLVDVMLVLLIIFLITIPVVLDSVDITLPDTVFEATTTKAENVLLTIRGNPDNPAQCQVYWGSTPVTSEQLLERGQNQLEQLLADIGGQENVTEENFPEVHIRGDVNTPYKCIGGAIYTMQFAGFQKIAFISEPEPGSALVRRL